MLLQQQQQQQMQQQPEPPQLHQLLGLQDNRAVGEVEMVEQVDHNSQPIEEISGVISPLKRGR